MLEGVELCVTKSPESIRVYDNDGRARIYEKRIDDTAWFKYEPDYGDPLDLMEVVENLQQRGGTGNVGNWFPDSWWFQATGSARFPDPLYRISYGFQVTRNPANILCSNAPGYAFGGAGIEMLTRVGSGRLRWTHGGLSREDSLGFIMTNRPDWTQQDAYRFNEALMFLSTDDRALPVTAGIESASSHR
jgi:hypothetical protein